MLKFYNKKDVVKINGKTINPKLELNHCYRCDQETNHHFTEDRSFRKCCKCNGITYNKNMEQNELRRITRKSKDY